MPDLTKKQTEYLCDLADGKSTYEIANHKSVSHHTVRNTLRNARVRMDCANSVSLVAEAISQGMIVKNGKGFIPNVNEKN